MLSETDRERIRRGFHLENKSIRQMAKEEGCSRDTIRRALSLDPLKPYQLVRPKPAPVLGPYQPRIEAMLGQNQRLPRKQRYTAHRIFETLRDEEGYQGSESTIRHAISVHKSVSRKLDVFLPLEFEPGQDAQVDWGEAQAVIAGQRQKVQFFVMRLCYSRRTFAMTFPTQKQESFLWAHVQAFKHFGGVPHRISYDNLGTAVKLAFEKTGKAGRPRHEVRAFVAFRSHYLFSSHFCTPGEGHEKGQVEGGVGYTRRNAMVPLPEASSFEDLNQQLQQRCLKEDHRRVSRQTQTIGEAWQQERALLLPLPPSDYECCQMTTVRLNPYSQATYDTNRYSVPVNRARREVTLKAYPFTVEIWDGMHRLSNHPRCYDREQDIFDPLHYLPLLEQRPGAFDYAKPLKQWRKGWPVAYHQMLANLREKWPNGRGVQEFVRILQLHQTYPAQLMEQAIEQALTFGCVHLDGVIYCLHQIESSSSPSPSSGDPPPNLDLSHRPDLDAIANQPIDLSRYDRLLKQSW
jgi:transposase